MLKLSCLDVEELRDLLRDVMTGYKLCFIVIDAIDECTRFEQGILLNVLGMEDQPCY